MIEAIIMAVLISVVVGLVLSFLVGPLIKMLPFPPAAVVGDFFEKWGWVLGLIAGLWYLFDNTKLLG